MVCCARFTDEMTVDHFMLHLPFLSVPIRRRDVRTGGTIGRIGLLEGGADEEAERQADDEGDDG